MNNLDLNMLEKELQWHVLNLADKYKVLAFHCPDSRAAYGTGFPDCVLSGKARTIFAELKADDTSKAYLKPAQRLWKEHLLAGSEEYYLWRPRHLLDGTVERVIASLNDE